MRKLMTVLFILLTVLGASIALAQDNDDEDVITHTVAENENLFRIAQQYDVTVQALAQANNITDPNSIQVGRVLIIPNTAATATTDSTQEATVEATQESTPEATPEATTSATPVATSNVTATVAPETTGRTHLVRDGENLYTIAGIYGVTVVSLAQQNGITNYSYIQVGQILQIPDGTSPLAPPAPTSNTVTSATMTPLPEMTPVENTAVPFNFASGVRFDGTVGVDQVSALGVEWIQHTVVWAEYETVQGNIDFTELDTAINALDQAGINILLTVTDAPEWSEDVAQDYATFVTALTEQYVGVVDAYEIWSEPNINWYSGQISAEGYADLLKLAFNAVKTIDSDALVITAGLAPTPSNDGVTVVNDRQFLRDLYAAEITGFYDAIGARPYGWANPPDSACCENNRPSVGGWDDHPEFFFLETLQAYRAIMNENNDSGSFIWVTAFGWGSPDGITNDIAPEFGYVTYTDATEQAQYTVRAFQIGNDLTYVGPMFVESLGACEAACYWNLLDANGQPRPLFTAIANYLQ